MIRPVMTNEFFLSQPSALASKEDVSVGMDLLDTLRAHSHECVGMAANMIGIRKRIIVFEDSGMQRLMFNPQITEVAGCYHTEEGCLSLSGQRPTDRFRRIKVKFLDSGFNEREETFKGFTAQIIQHEIDHCEGILI